MILRLAISALLVGAAGLCVWRWTDKLADRREADRLLASRLVNPEEFSMDMVRDLPTAAQRFFQFSIQEGTKLQTAAEIMMAGEFGMGDIQNPNYLPFKAYQVLSYPLGILWQMSGGKGVMRMSGSDSGTWTRFWLLGLIPVARAGGDQDHTLSAFGRYAIEAAIWTPAALLPGPGVSWEEAGDNTARVVLIKDDMTQTVEVDILKSGQPVTIHIMRWSNVNPDKEFRRQPFGGTLTDFKVFDGFQLATRVEAGNHFGTPDYFPFFKASVSGIRFRDRSKSSDPE